MLTDYAGGVIMKIALTIWGNRISPVFESAQNLLIVRIENQKVIDKAYETFDNQSFQLVEYLKNQEWMS